MFRPRALVTCDGRKPPLSSRYKLTGKKKKLNTAKNGGSRICGGSAFGICACRRQHTLVTHPWVPTHARDSSEEAGYNHPDNMLYIFYNNIIMHAWT
eukprot:COSAG01_NODE_21402_length_904_cov_0.514286_1_plen_96_part_10